MSYIPTEIEIELAKTPAGGWTRKTLAAWGVPWPPPRGWRKRLVELSKAAVDQRQIDLSAANDNRMK